MTRPRPAQHKPTVPVWGQVRLLGETPQEIVDFVRENPWGRKPLRRFDCGVINKAPAAPLPYAPRHKFVVIGDSLSHGFQHFAVHNTNLSWGAILAAEAGAEFNTPDFSFGTGMPINLESLTRTLDALGHPHLPISQLPRTLLALRRELAETYDTWQWGTGRLLPYSPTPGVRIHALAQWGFDVLDALEHTEMSKRDAMKRSWRNPVAPFLGDADTLSSARVLSYVHDQHGAPISLVKGAAELGRDGGIDTLIVALGANNALGTVKDLKVNWSDTGHDDLNAKTKAGYNLWRPEHFREVYSKLLEEVSAINAQRVVLCTVPHVTIAPLARGVGNKSHEGSRYFQYYTHPWIEDRDFQPTRDAHLTAMEARAIDGAIDCYNTFIEEAVREARLAGKDWYCYDLATLLDQLAWRRYIDDEKARPPWWHKATLPPELDAVSPELDTRFFKSEPHRYRRNGHHEHSGRRVAGGWFGLDGVHPTTTGYALLAWKMANQLHKVGVEFPNVNANGTVQFDWERWIAADTLISRPPRTVSAALNRIAQADNLFDRYIAPVRELARGR